MSKPIDEQITLIALTAINALREIAAPQLPQRTIKYCYICHRPLFDNDRDSDDHAHFSCEDKRDAERRMRTYAPQAVETARQWEVIEHRPEPPARLAASQTMVLPERPAGYVEPCNRIAPCYVPKSWREYDAAFASFTEQQHDQARQAQAAALCTPSRWYTISG